MFVACPETGELSLESCDSVVTKLNIACLQLASASLALN